jgi:hypothetical protein
VRAAGDAGENRANQGAQWVTAGARYVAHAGRLSRARSQVVAARSVRAGRPGTRGKPACFRQLAPEPLLLQCGGPRRVGRAERTRAAADAGETRGDQSGPSSRSPVAAGARCGAPNRDRFHTPSNVALRQGDHAAMWHMWARHVGRERIYTLGEAAYTWGDNRKQI